MVSIIFKLQTGPASSHVVEIDEVTDIEIRKHQFTGDIFSKESLVVNDTPYELACVSDIRLICGDAEAKRIAASLGGRATVTSDEKS